MLQLVLNVYKIKEVGAFILACLIPMLVFSIVSMLYGFLMGLLFWAIFTALFVWIAIRMLKNPFTDMLKGAGLLTLNIDSTGLISVFISRLSQGVVSGFFDGREVADSFNRNGVSAINAPVKTKGFWERDKESGCYSLKITDKELYDARFAFNQYPVLIYNNITGSFVTKQQLCNLEKNMIAHNMLVFLSKKVDDLSSALRNFGRYVVDSLKPASRDGGVVPNWLMYVIIFVAIALVGFLIWKAASSGTLSSVLSSAKSSISGLPPVSPMNGG